MYDVYKIEDPWNQHVVGKVMIQGEAGQGLDTASPWGEEHRSSGSVNELCEILSQVVIHNLHAVFLHDAHQDGLDDLVTKADAHALSWTQPEPPIRVTVLSGKELTEAIRSEDVSIRTPNRSIAVERISVDEDGSLWWDIVPVNDLRFSGQLGERVEQHRVETS